MRPIEVSQHGTPPFDFGFPMARLRQTIDEACRFIHEQWPKSPRVGIILGTGLGGVARLLQIDKVIPYEAIPGFPQATALSHAGKLDCGVLEELPVLMMEGRYHLYEGYTAAEITFPVRVMKQLGVELLIISNASGGMNPSYRTGDVMIIEDHINLMTDNPLLGIGHQELGPRYPDMCDAYDARLIKRAEQIARKEDLRVHRGTYVALTGPNYETRAEYRYLRRIGGDVVGMSTVPEVVVAAHVGLRVLALSTITNVCFPDTLTPTQGSDVVAAATAAEQRLERIVLGIVASEAGQGHPGSSA